MEHMENIIYTNLVPEPFAEGNMKGGPNPSAEETQILPMKPYNLLAESGVNSKVRNCTPFP
jgi:hypothetical protein